MLTKFKKGAKIDRAYNQELKERLFFDYEWPVYQKTPEGIAEFIAAKQEMNIKEQIAARNKDAQTKARQAAWTARLELAGIVKPTAENSPVVRLKVIYDALKHATKNDGTPLYTEEERRAEASRMANVPWPKSEDDEDDDDDDDVEDESAEG